MHVCHPCRQGLPRLLYLRYIRWTSPLELPQREMRAERLSPLGTLWKRTHKNTMELLEGIIVGGNWVSGCIENLGFDVQCVAAFAGEHVDRAERDSKWLNVLDLWLSAQV